MCSHFYTKALLKTTGADDDCSLRGAFDFQIRRSVGHLDTVHFTTKAVVLTISVRINFRQNLITTFISYDRKMKLVTRYSEKTRDLVRLQNIQ